MQHPYNTRAMFKYSNRQTGRVEFHEKEVAPAEHMVLVRGPDAPSKPQPQAINTKAQKSGEVREG